MDPNCRRWLLSLQPARYSSQPLSQARTVFPVAQHLKDPVRDSDQ